MNPLERELHYVFGDQLPEPGHSMEVLPGVRWVRMGLPFALDHINLWLLRDRIDGREGWTVVDTCISHAASRSQWEQIFATELQGLPVLRVVVTHMHPDHVGLADWICRRFDAMLWMSATDYHMARVLCTSGDLLAGGDGAATFFERHGLRDEEVLRVIRSRTEYFSQMVPSLPDTYVRMMDGDVLTIGEHHWRCIAGYGHAPEHISLYSESAGALLGGDMMLPRISTNVSVYPGEPEGNPLRLFLTSIERFRELPAQTLGLPAHGKPFTGIHKRIDQLQGHHRDRLAELLEACVTRPLSAAEGMPILFRRALDAHQTTFAMGETLAHLHELMHAGRVQRRLDSDGVLRFGTPARQP